MRAPLIVIGWILATMIAGSAEGGAANPFASEGSGPSVADFMRDHTAPEGRDTLTAHGNHGEHLVLSHAERLVIPAGTFLRGRDGFSAPNVERTGPAVGRDGGDGGNVVLRAPIVVFEDNVRILPGAGGNGGNATSISSPDAFAIGGRGGDAGRVIIVAERILGTPTILMATAGSGGWAQAEGAAGEDCSGKDGTPSSARGTDNPIGPGGSANAQGGDGACGPVEGDGGRGGNATAYGGDGGTSPDGNGGAGGNATAIGGRGGDGMEACFPHERDARASGILRAGNGGAGGWTDTSGGNGGPGWLGGRGGGAFTYAESGRGGNATYPIRVGSAGDVIGGGVTGGGGGPGVFGGAGGGAVGEASGGSSGSNCGELEWQGLTPGIGSTLLVTVISALAILANNRVGVGAGDPKRLK